MRSLFALCACAAAGCATLAGAESTAAKLLISPEQSQQIGLAMRNELVQKQNVKFITDPAVTGYVDQVASRILAQARRDRPDLKWQVQVIDDPKMVNAFATPGGYLYVYSGLLLAAGDDAELAGVLGHESGHVVARHPERNLVAAYGLDALSALALGNNPGLLAKLGSSVASQGFMLAHSRSEENDADEYGVRYASAAGYDPGGLGRFFQKLLAEEGHTPEILSWLSDHPTTPDRIAHVTAYIAQHHLGGSDRGSGGLAAVQARLRSLGSTARAPANPPPNR